uniref:Uncharacterized protein n=1 Tax=Aureimonas frigidaquae TaxID=424757 RepID=A0A0P0Z3J8_9HYPH|nr:hypothetical protein [Aureimonas frigidaquae]
MTTEIDINVSAGTVSRRDTLGSEQPARLKRAMPNKDGPNSAARGTAMRIPSI